MTIIKATWQGVEPTRIRLTKNGEKVEVAPGETVEVEKSQFDAIRSAYKQFVAVDPNDTPEPKKRKGAKPEEAAPEEPKKPDEEKKDQEPEAKPEAPAEDDTIETVTEPEPEDETEPEGGAEVPVETQELKTSKIKRGAKK